MVFVLAVAIGALKIPAVTAFMNEVLAYMPNVIAAIVIFVVAAAIAGAAGAAATKLMGDTTTGKLAFGLGGRDVAGRLLEDAYRKGQEERGRVRRDMEVGKERAKDQAQRAGTGLADGRGAGATAAP